MAVAGFSEWEIENFSCWNFDIHGESLTCDSNRDIILYPRAVGGKGQHLEVKIPWNVLTRNEALSFFCSDGSLICTRRRKYVLRPCRDGCACPSWEDFIGPDFENIVAKIRENQPRHKDRLILRWKAHGTPTILSTLIHASTVLFQIKSEMFHSDDWKPLSDVTFTTMDVKEQHLCVSVRTTDSETEGSKVEFKFESNDEKKFLVRTSIWLLEGDKIIPKREMDCVIAEGYDQTSFEIPLEDLQGIQSVMRFKIVTSHPSRILSYRVDEIKEIPSANSVSALTRDFMGLYQDHDFSDLELRCRTVIFPTHKNILSARSPVFKAMLSGDMKEATCGHVDVEDLDPHTLGRFLSYLYSGSTGEEALQFEEASKLYYAADKYQVSSLKKECAAVLRDSVALENVCDILSLADRHQDEDLGLVAKEFLLENYNQVLKSENWDKFMLTNSLLAVKTVTNFAKNDSVKNVIPTN